jgi:hypothetical protein
MFFIPCSFLVINVCHRGKTLCSPCISSRSASSGLQPIQQFSAVPLPVGNAASCLHDLSCIFTKIVFLSSLVVQMCVFVWVFWSVTTAWRVLRLRMEERPPIWRVAVNKFNKQPRTADEGWSSSLGVGRGANNTSP